jgi:hypothetical protein
VQIGTAVLVKVSVSVWIWQYVNSGLVGVQIGTAVLVRVSVFRDVQWIAYSWKCWTAWTVSWRQQSAGKRDSYVCVGVELCLNNMK